MTYPVAQRYLRATRGARLADRAAVTAEHLAFLSGHLTARDRWLVRVLHEHRVFTSTQLTRLAFGSTRTANQRLLQLHQWRVIDRFQPFLDVGTAPMHYVLDLAGAAVLAAEDGLPPNAVGYRRDRAVGIGHSLRLAHTVGVNDLYTALVAIARHTNAAGSSGPGERAVTAWWPETRCARIWGDLARPDAYGRWRENGAEIEFFLEYDTGTEPLTRVAGKLHDYHRLAAATAITTPVLFWFPTPAREAAARHALAATLAALQRAESVPVATTTAQPTTAPRAGRAQAAPDSPAGARWLTLDPGRRPATHGTQPGQRVRLAQLTWPHTGPGSLGNHRGPERAREPAPTPGPVPGAARLAAPEPMPPTVLPAYLTRAARNGR